MAKRRREFGYNLFCSNDKAKSFWRWEVFDLSTKIVCDAGFLYGTRNDAAAMAKGAITRLTLPAPQNNEIKTRQPTGSQGSKRTKR